MKFAVYNRSTGEIVRSVSVPSLDDVVVNLSQGESAIPGSFDDEYWYVEVSSSGYNAVKKSEIDVDVSPGEEGVILTGLPIPCTVSFRGVSEVVEDGEVYVQSDVPGRAEIVLSSRPRFLDRKVEINFP